MSSRMKVTCPSANRQLQPEPWKLNGSSLGPQSGNVQLQAAGPPNGWLELLSILPLKAAGGGPATIEVAAGSAQRNESRFVPPEGRMSVPIGSAYFGVKKNSLRPTASTMQIVLLSPSRMTSPPAAGTRSAPKSVIPGAGNRISVVGVEVGSMSVAETGMKSVIP